MLGFVQRWLGAPAHPIGVDFGSDTLRLAQVRRVGTQFRLVAAASCDVPLSVRNDPAQRLTFFIETVRDLLAQGNFQRREAVLAMPASVMQVHQFHLPRLDPKATVAAIQTEARARLPIPPADAVVRHLVAGQTPTGQQAIVMAGPRAMVEGYITAAERSKLRVVGMNVEPQAIVDCFGHLLRRERERQGAVMYVDIGLNGSRLVVSRNGSILFIRNLKYGGDWFNRAVAGALGIGISEARLLRIRTSAADLIDDPTLLTQAQSTELIDTQIDQACMETIEKLAEELDLCRRQCESTFAGTKIERMIFVGGEARDRALCRAIAQAMKLPAHVGDPLSRMARGRAGICIDRRTMQPAWAVALGLSMGPIEANV